MRPRPRSRTHVSEVTQMYRKILVPVDGSATSMLGLAEAIKLAKSLGSALRLVHVVNEFVLIGADVPGVYLENFIESLREGGKETLSKAGEFVRQHALEPQILILESIGGRAADLIVEQAKEWPADLIVMGTHGRRGIRRLVLGSDAELVLRSSPVPVLLVRGSSEST
jgi:nucleotide-binding universal stress UspA family protein